MASTAKELLSKFAAVGVSVTSVNGKLRIHPRGRATKSLLDEAAANKAALVAEVERERAVSGTRKTSKTPGSPVVEVVEGQGVAHIAPELSSLSEWCPDSAPAFKGAGLGLTKIVVIPLARPERDDRVLAQISLVFGDLVVVHGIHLIRLHGNHAAVRYPKVTCGSVSTDVIRPTSKGARSELDALILAEARHRGFLLTEPAPDPAGTDEPAPSFVDEEVSP